MTKSQTRLRQLRERQPMERGRMAELAVAESLTAETRAGLDSIEQCIAAYPVTTAAASAAQRGKNEAAGDTAWTLGVTEMKPKRNAATLKFSIEGHRPEFLVWSRL